MSETIGQQLKDAAGCMDARVRGRRIMSNVLENFPQNSVTCWVTFQLHMSWFSLFHCLCVWHLSVLCCLFSQSVSLPVSAPVFYFMHVTLSVVTFRGRVCSPPLVPPRQFRVNSLWMQTVFCAHWDEPCKSHAPLPTVLIDSITLQDVDQEKQMKCFQVSVVQKRATVQQQKDMTYI